MTPKQFVKAFAKHGSVKAVARNESMTYQNARKAYIAAVDTGLMAPLRVGAKRREAHKNPASVTPTGQLKVTKTTFIPSPPEGKTNVFIFSCIQNDTLLHEPLWENVQALLKHYQRRKNVNSAQLHIARFTYVKRGLGATGDKALIVKKETLYGGHEMTFAKKCEPYISDYRLEVANGLVWCGETNTLPTAIRPLSGFESYTGRKSGIFPHVKVAMDSVASMATEATKFNYTTGALTQRNYIQKKAGFKGEFHHCYGALLVEVDSSGAWWCRHLTADNAGTIYDLDLRVKNGVVEKGQFIDTIVWGDVHVAIADKENWDVCWGKGGMLDTLKPKRQIIHDILDMRARSHHEVKDPVKRFKRYWQDTESVEEECRAVTKALQGELERDWCSTHVVDSNHHRHLGRWLAEQDGRFDPINARFWISMWDSVYECVQFAPHAEPNYLALALSKTGYYGRAHILSKDESLVVCPDAEGGIELGLHGDIGPNGSRGSPQAYARMGRKMVVAHSHKAGITDGVYVVGTSTDLHPDYCWGPGAWSHTHCVIYENGKRALVTVWKGRYRAT